MWQKRLKLGTYFRIGVYVHWTFSFLIAYFAYQGFDGGVSGSAYGVLILCGMFLCVTLHEYGHALTARRFGVETIDITLFPIGGVARLAKIPRVPWQEFLVAVAGPAVNVVIGGLILGALFVLQIADFPPMESEEMVEQSLQTPSASGFLLAMLLVNITLVLFNLIPAFPMDGGRVLRSLLAMAINYRSATRVATFFGVLMAICMLVAAAYLRQPLLGFVALFIGYAGLTERRHVEMLEPIRHLEVRSVMILSPPRLSMDTPLGELPELLAQNPLPLIPVVGVDEIVTGMLSIEDVSRALRQGCDASTPVGMVARHDVETVSPETRLENILSGPKPDRYLPVADDGGHLIGLLDLQTVRVRGELAATRATETSPGATKN
ncbi:MAG: site-2 protease family protein [Planctomycetota bacterium]